MCLQNVKELLKTEEYESLVNVMKKLCTCKVKLLSKN